MGLKVRFEFAGYHNYAKANFSIGGYLSSAPQSAQLAYYMGFYTLSSFLTKAVLTAAGETAK